MAIGLFFVGLSNWAEYPRQVWRLNRLDMTVSLESELTNWTVRENTQRQSNLYEQVLDDNHTQLA